MAACVVLAILPLFGVIGVEEGQAQEKTNDQTWSVRVLSGEKVADLELRRTTPQGHWTRYQRQETPVRVQEGSGWELSWPMVGLASGVVAVFAAVVLFRRTHATTFFLRYPDYPVLGDETMKLPVTKLRLQKEFRLDRNNRKGASAVEFALVAPIFLALVFGMIEFGRAIMVQQVVINAAREGARVAVLDGATTSEVYEKVQHYLESSSVPMNSATTVSVSPDPPSSAGYGQPVSVSVSVPYSAISWLPGADYLQGVNLDATSVMRRETVQ